MTTEKYDADLVNITLIGKLDHDLQLLHLDVKWVIVFAEENLHTCQCELPKWNLNTASLQSCYLSQQQVLLVKQLIFKSCSATPRITSVPAQCSRWNKKGNRFASAYGPVHAIATSDNSMSLLLGCS